MRRISVFVTILVIFASVLNVSNLHLKNTQNVPQTEINNSQTNTNEVTNTPTFIQGGTKDVTDTTATVV